MATARKRNATAAEDEPELVDTNPTMANLINAFRKPRWFFRFYSNLISLSLSLSSSSSSSDFLASCDAGDLLRGNGWHLRVHGAQVLQPGRAALGGARVVRRAGAHVPGARLRGADAQEEYHQHICYGHPCRQQANEATGI